VSCLIELCSEGDWITFLEEAGKKAVAQGKLVIREKVNIPNQQYRHGKLTLMPDTDGRE
jgi:hypothetical protein